MAEVICVESRSGQGPWVASALERRGHTVTRVHLESAAQALEHEAQLWVIDGDPCAPAFEFISRLRKLGTTEQLPVLFLSPRDNEDTVLRAYAAGASGVLTPPLSRPQVIVQAQRLITASGSDPLGPLALRPGDVFAGRYTIRRRLGSGGNAVVFESTTESGEAVALKIADGKSCDLPESRQRLQREAYSLLAIDCAHTPQVLEVGRHGGREFLTLELIPGATLWERVGQGGPLSAEDGYNLLLGLAVALDSLQRAGLVHRDLKPGNVVLREDQPSWPVIVDFGLARDPRHDFLTDPDVLVGTAGYMSPEYICGRQIDHRADLYTMGHVVCYAVTGEQPWPQEQGFQLLSRAARETYRIPACVPDPLRTLLQRLVDVDPDRRPQSASALLNSLTAFPEWSEDPSEALTERTKEAV